MNFKELLRGKFVLDSVWLLMAYSVVALSGILINFVLGRFYGAEAIGIFNQAYSFFQIFAVIGSLGVNFSTVKHVAEYSAGKEEVRRIFSASQFLTVAISLGVAIIVSLSALAFPQLIPSGGVRKATIIIIIALPFFVSNKNQWALLIGFRRMREYSSFRLIRWVSILIIVSLWSVFHFPVVYAVIAFPVTDIILSLVMHYVTRDFFSFRDMRSGWVGRHLNFGYKSSLTEVLSSLYVRLPVLMIGYYLSDRDAGMYSVASTMASGILIITSTLQDNFNPIVAGNNNSSDRQQLISQTSQLRKFSMFSVIPLMLLSVVAYHIYIWFLGREYTETTVIFYFLIFGIGLSYLVSWAGGVLTMSGHQVLNLTRIITILLVTIIGCVILVPGMGVKGAAIAFDISALLNMIILYYMIRKKNGLRIL